jgi:hypothetical protein
VGRLTLPRADAEKHTGRPFHSLSLEGEAGGGKTFLAAGAPGKAFIQSSDNRWRAVIKQLYPDEWGERFLCQNYMMEVDTTPDEVFKSGENGAKEKGYALADIQAARINSRWWVPLVNDFKEALRDPEIKTIIWDQADELYEILRMANFGKIERNDQKGYVPVNAEWKGLIKQARDARKNHIMIHQLKTKWEKVPDANGNLKDQDTGKKVRSGSDKADYLVDSFISAKYVDPKRDTAGNVVTEGKFIVTIKRAKLNPSVNGMELEAPDWATLMMYLDPSIDPEEWLK